MTQETIIIIPARFGSTRLPGKPFVKINQISLLERVWLIANLTKANKIYVATDDDRIRELAHSFGANVIMTSKDCRTGTDRVAEAAKQLNQQNAFYINLQGDALLTPPWVIDDMIVACKNANASIITPARKLTADALTQFIEHKKRSPSSGTTVVFNKHNLAMYFSKQILPFARANQQRTVYKHIGLYAYNYATLIQLAELPQTPNEQAEQLEQLRALENGIDIQVVEVDYKGRTEASIDTQEDIKLVEKIISVEGELI